MIYNIVIAILSFMLCGDCVFLGVMSQTVLVTFNPSFYWWGVAGYVCAGFFGVWFIFYVSRGIARRRRNKERKLHNANKKRKAPTGQKRKKRK